MVNSRRARQLLDPFFSSLVRKVYLGGVGSFVRSETGIASPRLPFRAGETIQKNIVTVGEPIAHVYLCSGRGKTRRDEAYLVIITYYAVHIASERASAGAVPQELSLFLPLAWPVAVGRSVGW